MDKFGNSQSVARREDVRFLTGAGRYIDDTVPAGALYAYVLRSAQAHGVIETLDVVDATEMPGIHLILTAESLAQAGVTLAMKGVLVDNRNSRTRQLSIGCRWCWRWPRSESRLPFHVYQLTLNRAHTQNPATDFNEYIQNLLH